MALLELITAIQGLSAEVYFIPAFSSGSGTPKWDSLRGFEELHFCGEKFSNNICPGLVFKCVLGIFKPCGWIKSMGTNLLNHCNVFQKF